MQRIQKVLVFLLIFYCKISEVHTIKYTQINVTDEGFLNHNLLQTIGISNIRNDAQNLIEIQKKCYYRAEMIAKQKMISIFIHTNQSIKGQSLYSEINANFSKEYPMQFTKEELIFYSLSLEELLSKVELVYQEIYKNQCKVVLRVQEEDLLNKIKTIKFKFLSKNYSKQSELIEFTYIEAN